MGSKVKGTAIYIEVWTGVWTKVGGQKDINIDRAAGGYDTTDKDSGGWEESVIGNKNWGISFDAFLLEDGDDSGFLQIESNYEDGVIGNYRIKTEKHTYVGLARIEGLNFTGPLTDVSNVSFTLKGTAALVKG